MFNAKHEFGDDIASRLDATICPGCGANLEAKAPACHECGYGADFGRSCSHRSVGRDQ